MTSNDAPDLPVAAEADYVDRPTPEINSAPSLEVWPKEILYDIDEKTSLVRKSDAEDAVREARRQERKEILDRIEKRLQQAEGKVNKYNGLDRLNLNDAKARREELEELRDELQQQEKEYKEEFGATQIAKGKPKNKDVKPEKDEVQNK